MTTIPKPVDSTQSFAATYDAWNRLVRIEEGANKVAEYEYDGAKRRTVNKVYDAGVLDKTLHYYYSEPKKWQVVEERIDGSSAADRQFVWGRYLDQQRNQQANKSHTKTRIKLYLKLGIDVNRIKSCLS